MATGNSKKSGLGRGLGALIARTDSEDGAGQPNPNASGDNQPLGANRQPNGMGSGGVLRVPLEAITPNPHQPRSHFDLDALEELAASVREHGIIQPLIVTQAKGHPPKSGEPIYWLIAGERRLRAAQLAGLTLVPVIVREASARQLMELALIENIQREDLNPLEEAAAYQALMDEYQLKQGEVAERVGKSRPAVANSLRLLNLAPQVQEALLAQNISSGHARALLGLVEDEQIDIALEQIMSRQLSVRQTEALVKELQDAAEEAFAAQSINDREDPMASHWRSLEDRFRNALGTKVALNRNANGAGRLVVHFYNDDDLDSLLRHIAGDEEELL